MIIRDITVLPRPDNINKEVPAHDIWLELSVIFPDEAFDAVAAYALPHFPARGYAHPVAARIAG